MSNWDIAVSSGLPIDNEDSKIRSIGSLLDGPSLDRLRFAADVISNKQEPWLVRAETCRFLRDIEHDDWDNTGLCEAVLIILRDNNDNLTVRQWAAFLVNKCQHNDDVAQAASEVIVTSEDIRWNIVDSLTEAEDISPEMRRALESIVLRSPVEDEVRDAVENLLV